GPISDPVVDGVRGGVRYIGIEAAVPVSLIQEELAQARNGGGGVSMSTPRWGRIDETDPDAGGGLAGPGGHRDGSLMIPHEQLASSEPFSHRLDRIGWIANDLEEVGCPCGKQVRLRRVGRPEPTRGELVSGINGPK